MKIITTVKNLNNHRFYQKVERALCDYLDSKNYLKVDVPVLSPALIPESYLDVFESDFTFLGKKEKMYLTPSPELFLKRLLAYGVGDCYFLGKSFRNGELPSELHASEFVMLEFYKMKADYMDIADDVLNMLKYISKEIKKQKSKIKITNKKLKLKEDELIYNNKKISFERWEKISVAEAFKKYATVSKQELFDERKLLLKAKKKGYKVDGFKYEDIFSQIYVQEIEPKLGKNGYPTLIYDYPKQFAALAKLNDDGLTSQRFEFYIDGIELGDCYSELTDWKEMEKRYGQEIAARKKNGKTSHTIDKGFIETLKYGLGSCSGIAIGFERLAMIFADVTSIDKLKLINIA